MAGAAGTGGALVTHSGLRAMYEQARDDKGEMRVENLEETGQRQRRLHHPRRSGRGRRGPGRAGLAECLFGPRALESGERQAGPGEDCVQLMTLHMAKGLEFPLVFWSDWRKGCSRTAVRRRKRASWRKNGGWPTSASPAPSGSCISARRAAQLVWPRKLSVALALRPGNPRGLTTTCAPGRNGGAKARSGPARHSRDPCARWFATKQRVPIPIRRGRGAGGRRRRLPCPARVDFPRPAAPSGWWWPTPSWKPVNPPALTMPVNGPTQTGADQRSGRCNGCASPNTA